MKQSNPPKRKIQIFGMLAALVLASLIGIAILAPERGRTPPREDPAKEQTAQAPPGAPTPPPSPSLAGGTGQAGDETLPLHRRGVDPAPRSQVHLRPLVRPERLPGLLTGPQPGDPLAIALEHIRATQPQEGYQDADLADPVVKDKYVSRHNGVTHIVLRQQIGGIEIYNADINVNLTRDGSIINLHNRFVRDLADEINLAEPLLSAEQAITRAAAHLDVAVSQALALKEQSSGARKAATYSGGGVSRDPIPVKLTYFPSGDGQTRLAWNLVVRMDDGRHWWDMNVDAETGVVLSKNNWIASASYNIIPEPFQSPDDGTRSIVSGVEDPAASPFGWHDTDGIAGGEFTDTRGNNVEAQEDRDHSDDGGFRPDGGPGTVLDFPLDLAQEPVKYQAASIVNLFYWNNICHDIHYHYGFDEQSGNFQQNNYGNGGLDGDAVQADSQDGSGTNNANFGTPPDGSRPRMQMFEFTFTSPRRDSSFDHLIVVHEYGHGVSNRLTGGPANASALSASQSRGLGEGWSDWWSLALTAKPAETGPLPRPVGTYVKGEDMLGGAGIRPAPYSTDLGVNSLTFGDLASGTLSVPHGIGTVWCTAIWEAFAKRGMGFSADDTGDPNKLAVTEAFDAPDDLRITPDADFLARGTAGGPFAPTSATYTLKNSGAAPLTWSATTRGRWYSLSQTGGSLAPGATTDLVASVKPAVNGWAAGTYNGTLTIENVSSGYTDAHDFTLAVDPFASIIFAEDFESASLGPFWAVSGTNEFRTQVTDEDGPRAGAYHLTMDDSIDGGPTSRNELTLTLDLSVHENVVLSFWAREYKEESNGPPATPFTGGADFDGVAISSDGVDWYEVQGLRSLSGTYTKLTVDLDAAIATHGLSDTTNFKIRFNQFDNFSIPTDGIAIDDILITGDLQAEILQVSVPAEATEGDGALVGQGVVTASSAPVSDLVVSLSSDTPSEAAVPSSVTIPGGMTTATFDLTIIDDGDPDGSRTAMITASTAGWTDGATSILVHDNESAALSVALPTGATEGDGVLAGQGTVTSDTAPFVDTVVTLASSDVTELAVPATVTLPAGQMSAAFDLSIIDDGEIDGFQSAVVTATVENWTGGAQGMAINDNEALSLSLSLAAEVAEVDGFVAGIGFVSISGTLTTDLLVSISSDDPSELKPVALATITAGDTSGPIHAAAVDDAVPDGRQTVNLTTTAAGFSPDSQPIDVIDDDVDHFSFAAIASPQSAGTPFAITVTAETVDNETIASYSGAATLNATGDGGAVIFSPPATGSFSGGSWTGSFAVDTIDTNVRITATAGSANGMSAPFDVVLGPLDHFVWNTVPSPQEVSVPFNVTITAVDAGGNPVPYTGTVDLQAFASLPGGEGDTLPPPTAAPETGSAEVESEDPDAETASTATSSVSLAETPARPDQHAETYAYPEESPPAEPVDGPPAPAPALAPGAVCLLVNGDFETGDLTGWTQVAGDGPFVINDGTLDPPGPDGPLAPCGGSFSAVNTSTGPETRTLYQDVSIPAAATSATLRWTDMIRNHADAFEDPNHEFRVELRDPADDSVLASLFSTNPGDPLLNGCALRSVDVSAYIGQTVRVAFVEQDDFYYFNVHLDDICLEVTSPPLAMSPAVSGNFIAGVWTGNVSVDQAATEAILVATATGSSESGGSNGFDMLGSAGPDETPPTLASSDIVDDQSGGPVFQNAPLTYTLTFSEDMDDTSFSPADFGNGAAVEPANITIGTITETAPGVFTVEVTPITPGKLEFEVPIGASLDDAAGNPLNTSTAAITDDTTITVNPPDTTNPTLLPADIVDDQTGGPVNQNSLLIYTVTFSEDMDAYTVDAADFGDQDDDVSLTIGTITETSPGVFRVPVTPTTPGTLELEIVVGAVLADPSGNPLDTSSAITDDTSITVNAPTSGTILALDFGTAGVEPGFVGQTAYSAAHTTPAGDVTVAITDNPQGFDVHAGGGTNPALFDDFIFDHSGPFTMTLSGPGISANTNYNLTFWSYDGVQARNTTITAVSGTTGTTLGPIGFDHPATSLSDNSASGTFTSDPSGNLTFSLGADRPALNGFKLVGEVTDGGNDFSDWIAGYSVGGQTGIADDPDLDGVDSGVENFFGTAPDTFTQGLVSGTVDTGANTFTFTHPLNATPADDLTATYRWSTNLQDFYDDGDSNGAGTTTVDFAQGTPSGGMVTVTATISGTVIPDKLFVDVEVTQN